MKPLPVLPDRYVCLRQLGEGATGIVYHAEDRLLETEVAVKVVKPNLALHRRFRARFAREVALSARIHHPHVIPVHDSGVLASGEPYVVLGYAAGGSLADLFALKPPLADVLVLMDEVLDALAAIHARQLLHQDLKPQNVLLYPGIDGRPHVWVADLGVADALAELVRDRRSISGTPPYMAPEQLHGRTHDLGPWTDLYAVGLMLYEALTGTRAHEGEGRLELLEARNRPPPTIQGVPLALADVVTTLLDPFPRQRFDKAADVRRALRDALRGESFRGRTVPWTPGGRGTGPTTARTGEFPLAAPVRSGPTAAGALRWNRVPPDPMPPLPPPERGWEAPARASLSLFALREVPLVGRERERRVLWDAAREVVALSEPRVVLVVGESGSGKTRLSESVATLLDEMGVMEVTRLRYHAPAGVDDGYRGAVRDLLVPWNDNREGMETRLAAWLARDRQVPPASVHEEAVLLARWCGYSRPGEAPVSDAIGLAFLYRHLDVRAWRGGSCLILEDVHNAQADGDGLAIAEALLDRTVGERPVLVLCTVSQEAAARDAGLRRTLEGLQERGARRLGLRRLSLTDTRRVVSESLQLAPDLAHDVSTFCEGDPLAAGLLLREWATRALPVLDKAGNYVLPAGPQSGAYPDSPERLLRRRVDGAIDASADPAAARDALMCAALAGQQPPVALVRRLNDPGVDALLATGLVAEQHGYLAFEHGRIQQLIVEDARSHPDVQDVHRRLGDAWEELGGQSGLDVDLAVGKHRLRAGTPERAIAPLLGAARKLNAGGRGDAVRVAAMAVEAADAVGQPTARLEARRLHAEALLENGEPERARPLLEYAIREVEGDRLARARLRVQLGRAARKQGEADLAEREFSAARAVFEALRDRAGLVEVAVQRARLARMEGRSDDAVKHWTDVLRMNRGDFGLESEALNGLCEGLIRAGRYENLERQLQRLDGVARASGDVRRIAEAHATWGMLHLERREYELAAEFLSAAGAIAATIGADRLHLRARTLLAEVRRATGDLDGAEEIIRWAARFAGERGQGHLVASARVQLAMLALVRYDMRRVQEEVVAAELALAHSPRNGLWLQIGVLRAWLAAEENDERSTRAWFAVAKERGLHTSQASDLQLPVQRLVAAAERRGWGDIARRAAERVWRVSTGEVELEEDPDDTAG